MYQNYATHMKVKNILKLKKKVNGISLMLIMEPKLFFLNMQTLCLFVLISSKFD